MQRNKLRKRSSSFLPFTSTIPQNPYNPPFSPRLLLFPISLACSLFCFSHMYLRLIRLNRTALRFPNSFNIYYHFTVRLPFPWRGKNQHLWGSLDYLLKNRITFCHTIPLPFDFAPSSKKLRYNSLNFRKQPTVSTRLGMMTNSWNVILWSFFITIQYVSDPWKIRILSGIYSVYIYSIPIFSLLSEF